jgi:hypothetical protein
MILYVGFFLAHFGVNWNYQEFKEGECIALQSYLEYGQELPKYYQKIVKAGDKGAILVQGNLDGKYGWHSESGEGWRFINRFYQRVECPAWDRSKQ